MLRDQIEDAVEFEIDGIRFVTGFNDHHRAEAFTLVKPIDLVERYRLLMEEFDRPRMMELGIAHGGSVALFTAMARPEKLIAIEYQAQRLEHLDQLISSRGLHDSIRPYYGVDQADRDRLTEILESELGGASLDVVIDDASHRYAPTLASFETLFPRVRPGGLYVIEDWVGLHTVAAAVAQSLADGVPGAATAIRDHLESGAPQEEPLSRLAVEFMLTQTSPANVISEVVVNRHWIAARRGDAELPNRFRLAACYRDEFHQL